MTKTDKAVTGEGEASRVTVEEILTKAENSIIDVRGCSRLTARTYLRSEILKADNSYYGKNGV